MKTVRFGRTGVPVSQLCFGTMSFGDQADASEAKNLYAACRKAGVTFFDCANVYSNGLAEEILGSLIASERDEIILTSKCAMPSFDVVTNPLSRGANRRHIIRSVEASLKRLGTDHLDVLFMHQWDVETPLDQTLRALDDLVRSGKVLYLGCSNYAAYQTATALGLQRANGWAPFDVIQPMYNLVKRQAEVEILPLAQAEDLAVICYGPGGGGMLTGKYAPGIKPNDARLSTNVGYAKRYDEAWYYETAAAFTDLAKSWGHHPLSLAIAWAAAHPGITCPIIGARNTDQLKASLAAVDINLSPEQRDQISALSRTPPVATDRLEDQR
jgi:aryl-alcohol dehydrogenase-like predicted oxidoreductase